MTSAPDAFTPERRGRTATPTGRAVDVRPRNRRPIPRTCRAAAAPDGPAAAYGGAVLSPGRRASRPIVAGRIATTALLAGLLLGGCTLATAPGPGAPPATLLQPSTEAAPSGEPAAADVVLPWPAATSTAATALQADVDRGAQPWLLDPSEVAIAYAAAAHDWPDAEAYPGPDGTSVDVRNADGERVTLSLAQPGRSGADGIWVVTAEHT